MEPPNGRELTRVPLPDRDLLAEQLLSELEFAVLMAPDDEPIVRLQAMWDDLKRGRVR
ncbi:MAG: hypothetical protein LCH96_02300 [Actinobacteria bacterium]|nr:hypothetical protein [Actinomycetota bacterium]